MGSIFFFFFFKFKCLILFQKLMAPKIRCSAKRQHSLVQVPTKLEAEMQDQEERDASYQPQFPITQQTTSMQPTFLFSFFF